MPTNIPPPNAHAARDHLRGVRFATFSAGASNEFILAVQGSAKRWALGCVNLPSAARAIQEAGFTQPTGLFIAGVYFQLPHISGIGGLILKPFGLVVVISCSFCLVYLEP